MILDVLLMIVHSIITVYPGVQVTYPYPMSSSPKTTRTMVKNSTETSYHKKKHSTFIPLHPSPKKLATTWISSHMSNMPA